MWQTTTVAPDVGEHAEEYARHLHAVTGKKSYRPALPATEAECAGLLLDLSGVFAGLTTDLYVDRSLPRTIVSLCRLIHEALALLGRIGLSKAQVNAVLSAALGDEKARVDPAMGFLDDNDGKAYTMGGAVQDPPKFIPFWVDGMTRKLRLVGIGK